MMYRVERDQLVRRGCVALLVFVFGCSQVQDLGKDKDASSADVGAIDAGSADVEAPDLTALDLMTPDTRPPKKKVGVAQSPNMGKICDGIRPCINGDECVYFQQSGSQGMCLGYCQVPGQKCNVASSTQLSVCALQLSAPGEPTRDVCLWLCEVSGTKFDCPDAKNFTCEVYDVTQPQIKVCIPEVYKHPAPPPGPKTCKNWNEWALFSAGNHGGCKAECIQTSPSHLHSVHCEFVMGDWGCYCFVNSNLRVLHSKELKPFVTSLYLSPCAMVKEVYAKVPKCHL